MGEGHVAPGPGDDSGIDGLSGDPTLQLKRGDELACPAAGVGGDQLRAGLVETVTGRRGVGGELARPLRHPVEVLVEVELQDGECRSRRAAAESSGADGVRGTSTAMG